MFEEKKVILIAEDENDLLEMYSLAIAGGGYEVIKAQNGKEVFEELEKGNIKPDLILLDIVMPIMDGFETLEKLKKDERFRKIPVVISTNLDNEEDKAQTLDLGAKEYFVKSRHTPAELVRKIDEMF